MIWAGAILVLIFAGSGIAALFTGEWRFLIVTIISFVLLRAAA